MHLAPNTYMYSAMLQDSVASPKRVLTSSRTELKLTTKGGTMAFKGGHVPLVPPHFCSLCKWIWSGHQFCTFTMYMYMYL